jgi:hypothetical protein
MKSAVYVEFNSTAHARLANTPATTALYVRLTGSVVSLAKNSDLVYSHREVRSFLSYGIFTSFCHQNNTGADHILVQHCILTWIQQDSAKGQCPMCRQSKEAFENKGIYFLIQSRVRVETGRRMKEGGALLVCIASAQEAWVGWGSFLSEIPLTAETNTGAPLLQSSRYVDCIFRQLYLKGLL